MSMAIDDIWFQELGSLIYQCEKVVSNDWDLLALVYDVSDTHTANSGFLYSSNKVRPFSASISGNPLLLDEKVKLFREDVDTQFGKKFKQLLIQIDKQSGKIKIDFEFDDSSKWTITPKNMKEMRARLKPNL